MSHNIFGWGLPPGVSVNDIPGNTPEDEKWERIIDGFWHEKRFTKKEWFASEKLSSEQFSSEFYNIITKAIDYGIELGHKEE